MSQFATLIVFLSVTRLIKASKNQKPTRDALLASSSSSTLSFVKPEVPIGSKLAAAQSELQACEAHLATKERELDVMRTVAVRTGLQARCKALVECGWTWGEMGKEALRALETLEFPSGMNGHGEPCCLLVHFVSLSGLEALPQSQLPYNKPLPESGQSDLSSIGPSQSASQERHASYEGPSTSSRPITQLFIPPAHSISDHALPNGTVHYGEPEETGGSSDEDATDEAKFEVRENDRFSQRKPTGNGKAKGKEKESKAAKGSVRSPQASSSRLPFPGSASTGQIATKNKPRQRQTSSSMFSSISAFFHKTPHNASDADIPAMLQEPQSLKLGSRWKTRTDKNLSRSRKRDSSDEDSPTYPRILPADPIASSSMPNGSAQRLKKRSTKRNTVQVVPIKPEPSPEERGWASDSGTIKGRSSSSGPRRGRGQTKYESEQESPVSPRRSSSRGKKREVLELSESESPATPVLSQKSKKTNGALSSALSTEASISRNNSLSRQSITSAASAPVGISSPTTIHLASPPSRSNSTASHSHKRTVSLDASSNSPTKAEMLASKGHKKVLSNAGYPPRQNMSNGELSLMSIVEGVAKQNREHQARQDPNRMLFLPKAPPPASQMLSLESVPENPSPDLAGPSGERPSREREPSERSVPLTPSIPAPEAPIIHHPSPDLKPLRPALRNSSRSPSPIILSPVIPAKSSPSVPATSPLTIPIIKSMPNEDDDGASISSYETTHETLDDEEEEETSTPTPSPPVPPKQDPQSGSDLSNSTNSTSTVSAGAPQRRKSVRMSLPPTFSATPPALEDTDDTDETPRRESRYEPWSSPKAVVIPNGHGGHANAHSGGGGWRSKIQDRDMWQDSSEDEDEDYKTARRLLSKFTRGKH